MEREDMRPRGRAEMAASVPRTDRPHQSTGHGKAGADGEAVNVVDEALCDAKRASINASCGPIRRFGELGAVLRMCSARHLDPPYIQS